MSSKFVQSVGGDLEPIEIVPVEVEPVEVIVVEEAQPLPVEPPRRSLTWATVLVVIAVIGGSLYANLSCLVRDPADYRFFPPFQKNQNLNHNEHLGAEYYSIAKALIAGRGYADPFRSQTGPTAWMPPVLPVILAGLHWIAEGDTEIVTALFVLLQDLSLIATGILILCLVRRTTGQVGLATLFFVGALTFYFHLCFQFTHDCWLVLAALDLVIAGMVFWRPYQATWKRAALWGLVGGFCALCSPIAGFVWGVLALPSAFRRGQRLNFAVAVLMSVLTISPWVIRNWLLFGRLIPVKSNVAYELYQSQCLQPGGVLQGSVFATHPFSHDGEERYEYKRMGEMAYLDKKMELFKKAVAENPGDFVERMSNRFFAATLEYMPMNPGEETRRPWVTWISRLVYPLPFLALLVLVVTAPWRPLAPAQWVVIGAYVGYLVPYVIVSFYDRYKFPVFATEVALVVWGIDRLIPRFDAAQAQAAQAQAAPVNAAEVVEYAEPAD